VSDALSAREQDVRDAIAQAMRDDDPEVADEAIAEAQSRLTMYAHWRSKYVISTGSRTTTVEDKGVARNVQGLRSALTRPTLLEQRIEEIVTTAAEIGDGATRDVVARRLERADEWGVPHSDFKRDVRAAGGWEVVKRRAGIR
jgi:hypothetical protein